MILNPVDQHALLLGVLQLACLDSSAGPSKSRWSGVVGGAATTLGARKPATSATTPRNDFMMGDDDDGVGFNQEGNNKAVRVLRRQGDRREQT